MKIFLISPVAGASPEDVEAIKRKDPNAIKSEELRKIYFYVDDLEEDGEDVHWPIRDTHQDDPTGGYRVCHQNFIGILDADEIHIWYDEKSGGSKFDMGGTFMLTEMLGERKKIVIANADEIIDNSKKSLFKVFKQVVFKQNF